VTPASKPRPPLPEGPYLVVGLARSGQAAARVLAERGEEVIGVDAGRPEGAEGLARAGVEINLDGDGDEHLDRIRCVVKSPGVPRDVPAVAAALRRRTPVIGELELGWRLLANRFVAVTGTNGKTSVTELCGHLWRTAGEPVEVAGNVGTPLTSLVGRAAPGATVVCECSSFQLEDAEAFAPECGAFLNLAADHLDRHPSLDDYLAAKLRIFANQGPNDVAIVNADEPVLHGRELPGEAERVTFCRASACDMAVTGGTMSWHGEPLLEVRELRGLGEHTAANALAAAAAALASGLGAAAVAEGLRTFEGLPHRLEPVAEVEGVRYVNDSKATNVAAARAALQSFEGGVRAILGGRPKGERFDALAGPIADRCVACYLIGEAAEHLERDLVAAWEAGIELHVCGDLAHAFTAASADAKPGEVVLLVPACSSFDAYRDFEERGEHFRSLVEELR
jgi:UDP-N-acetylmuramoylalanine--D-glutamate ligase